MPRIPIAAARRRISSPSQAPTVVMRGKRIATTSAAAASALAMGAHAPYQVTALAFVGGGGVPPPPLSPSSMAHGRSTAACYAGGSCIATSRRFHHSLAFHNQFHSRGGVIRLNAAATATLDLSASSASNEYLHTLSEADDDNNNNNNANNNNDQSSTKPRHQLPRPIVICGPSGVGKGTIINALLQKFPSDKFGFSVSHTTRPPRPGEVNGTHYHFVSVDQIQTDIAEGKFLEYAEVHGNYYGTSLEAVQSVQSQGKLCILDIDVQGVQTIKSQHKLPDALYVFVAPPSVDNLEQRLRGRGTETEETLTRRLGNAQREMEYGYGEGNFDYVLVNGELDVAVDELADKMRGWYPTLDDVDGGDEEEK